MINVLAVLIFFLDFVCVFFSAKLVPITIEERTFKKDYKAWFLKDSWDESGKPTLSFLELFGEQLSIYDYQLKNQ